MNSSKFEIGDLMIGYYPLENEYTEDENWEAINNGQILRRCRFYSWEQLEKFLQEFMLRRDFQIGMEHLYTQWDPFIRCNMIIINDKATSKTF